VKTGIQKKLWIPAGVYPGENRGRNDQKPKRRNKKAGKINPALK